MDEQTDLAAKAEAARAREAAERKRTLKTTITFGLAMFGIVFALLSFKYVTGNDPSSQRDSLSTQQEVAPAQDDYEGDDEDEYEYEEEDDDGWQQQPPSQSAPPTTGAS